MPTFCLLFDEQEQHLPFSIFLDCSKIIFKSKISIWLLIFIIFIEIFPQTWALLGSKVFITVSMSFSVTWKELILLPILYEKDGKKLALSTGVHIEAKKLLKMLAFTQKYETNLPSTSRDFGIFYYRANRLI